MKSAIFFIFACLWIFQAEANPARIILDPAHGGTDEPKVEYARFDERNVNLDLAKKIQAQIETNDEFEVVMTRIGDYPLSLTERRKIANQYAASVFVSIHSSTYDTEPSVITYLMKQPPAKTLPILTPIETVTVKSYNQSIKLAQAIEDQFPEHIDHQIEMVKFPLASLIGISSGAILIECQCIAKNTSMADAGVIDTIARAASDGIQNFARKAY